MLMPPQRREGGGLGLDSEAKSKIEEKIAKEGVFCFLEEGEDPATKVIKVANT